MVPGGMRYVRGVCMRGVRGERVQIGARSQKRARSGGTPAQRAGPVAAGHAVPAAGRMTRRVPGAACDCRLLAGTV